MKTMVVKKIRNTKWWQADGPVVFQLLQPPIIAFSKVPNYYKGLKYSPLIFLIENDYGYQFISEDDSIRWIKFLINKDKRNKNYIKNKIKRWEKLEKKFFSLIKEIEKSDLSKLNNFRLYSLFQRFYSNLTNVWVLPLILEGEAIYFEKSLVLRISAICGLSKKEILKKISVLTTPEKTSFVKKEHSELLEIALQFIRTKVPFNISLEDLKERYPQIYKKILDHQKKFFWLKNNYKDIQVISPKEFLQEIKDILKNNSKQLIKQKIQDLKNINALREEKKRLKKELKISRELIREIDLFSIFSWWKDERKRLNLISSHYLSLFIKEISKRIGIDYKEGYYLLNEEVKGFLLKNKKIDRKKLRERRRLIFIFVYKNTYKILSGHKAKFYRDEIFRAMKGDSLKREKFRGLVAYRDRRRKITGKVSVVLDVKRDKFKKGNILVTSMTRPEFVPLMKKAKAIVTSEGGITSHAAIVARELKIPCIIGTKIDSTILKNEDEIELDLENGVVKLLKTCTG